MGLTGVSSDRWWQDILSGIKAPDNKINRSNLNAWQACEGGSAEYNPFNTTLAWPGSSCYNSVCVRNYPSLLAGESATISTLLQSNMSAIVHALRNSYDRAAFADAVGNSPWGTSGACIRTAPGGGTKGGNPGPGPGQPSPPPPAPKPSSGDSWAPHIRRTAAQFGNTARTLQDHATGLRHLTK